MMLHAAQDVDAAARVQELESELTSAEQGRVAADMRAEQLKGQLQTAQVCQPALLWQELVTHILHRSLRAS